MSELGLQVGSLGTLTKVVKVLVAVSVLTSYPILMNVLVREMETATGVQPDAYDSRARYLMSRTLLRSVFIVLSTAVAVFMPYFQDFMELVGALCPFSLLVSVLCLVLSFFSFSREQGTHFLIPNSRTFPPSRLSWG